MGDTGPDTTISSDSERVLAGALTWLADHVDWFGPLWDEHFPPRPFEGATLLELLSLCRVLRRNGVDDPRARRLFDLALPLAERTARSPGFSRALSADPETLLHRWWLLALLADLGRPLPGPSIEARRLARDHRAHGGPGVSPVYALEEHHIRSLAGEAFLGDSLPGRFSEALAFHREGESEYDAYGITHAVLYAADLGTVVPPRGAPWTDRHLGELIELWERRDHLDLVAELLMCSRLMGREGWEHVARRAWSRLAAEQRPDGSLPGPPFDEAVAAGRSGERATAYVFRTCHHTTLVAAMAAAAERGEGHGGTPRKVGLPGESADRT
ncbi:DUF6895 family protein [Nocardiopsis alba]|uniref:DUF6895 family protein n=1 Tax=Nocardiopsis alba TaxID=53437 RepID=UPI0036729594